MKKTGKKPPRSTEDIKLPIIGVEGPIGSGKTTVLTAFGLMEYACLNKPLWANFHFKQGIAFHYLTFQDMMDLAQEQFDFERAAIFIMEAHTWLDSRIASSKMSRLFTYWMLQTGKQEINMYYDTQDFRQVDIRLRKMTDIAIHVRRKGNLHLLKIRDMHTGKKRNAVLDGSAIYPYFNTKEVAKLGRAES